MGVAFLLPARAHTGGMEVGRERGSVEIGITKQGKYLIYLHAYAHKLLAWMKQKNKLKSTSTLLVLQSVNPDVWDM